MLDDAHGARSGLHSAVQVLRRPLAAWTRFPVRTQVWAVIVLLSFFAVTAMLHSTPEVALQYWWLYGTPLSIAAFVFGLRGALAGAIFTVGSFTLLYYSSVIVHAQLSAALEPLLDVGFDRTSTGQVIELVTGMANLAARDPTSDGAQAFGGLLVTVLTTLFFGLLADRGRNQERQAVERASMQLKRYFSPQLVETIVNGGRWRGVSSVRKEITVLFADLRGFTALTERLEPEELATMLNEYLSEMTDVIFKHDGTLDKYIGDAVMAFFGDPVEHGDDPERAVRAAVEMRERFLRLRSAWDKEGRETVHVGIGINTGYATVGNVGSTVRLEYTVVGSTVNVGARLADLAAPGQILATPRTMASVSHLVEWRALGGATLQGVAYPVELVEILGVRLAARDENASGPESWESALIQAAEDPVFRAIFTIHPQTALQQYQVPANRRALVLDVVGLLGYTVFRGVPGREVVELVRQARLERYAAGTIIARGEAPLKDLRLVARGEVSLYQKGEDGRERHQATLGRGAHFGAAGVGATVRALSDVELFTVADAAMRHLETVAPTLIKNLRTERDARETVVAAKA